MGRVLRDAAPQERRRDGQAHSTVDLSVEYHLPAGQVQPLDAVALAAPGVGDHVLRSLPGGLYGVKWELFLPLASHIGRGLVKPERLEVTGLPVQFKADDPLNFLESQCHRRLTHRRKTSRRSQ